MRKFERTVLLRGPTAYPAWIRGHRYGSNNLLDRGRCAVRESQPRGRCLEVCRAGSQVLSETRREPRKDGEPKDESGHADEDRHDDERSHQ